MSAKDETAKSDVIAGLEQARSGILNAASALSPSQQDEVFLGVWTIKDLLAHLIGWDFANIEAVHALQAGRLPEFYAHYDPDWKTFNAGLVARYKHNDFAELVDSVRDSHQQLIALLNALPAEEINRDRGLRTRSNHKITIGYILRAEARDEQRHLAQIQEFAARPRPEE